MSEIRARRALILIVLVLAGLGGCRSSLEGRAVTGPPQSTRENATGASYYLTRPTFSLVRRTGEKLAPVYDIEVGARPDPTRRFEVGMSHGLFTSDTFDLSLAADGRAVTLNSKTKDEVGPVIASVLKLGAAGAGLAAKAMMFGAGSRPGDDDAVTWARDQGELTPAQVNLYNLAKRKLRRETAPLQTITLDDLMKKPLKDSSVFLVATATATHGGGLPGVDVWGMDASIRTLTLDAGNVVGVLRCVLDGTSPTVTQQAWVKLDSNDLPRRSPADLNAFAAQPGDRFVISGVGTLTSGSVSVGDFDFVRYTGRVWVKAKLFELSLSPGEARAAREVLSNKSPPGLKEKLLARLKKVAVDQKELEKIETGAADTEVVPDTSKLEDHLERLGKAERLLADFGTDDPAFVLKRLQEDFTQAAGVLMERPDDPTAQELFMIAEFDLRRALGTVLEADDRLKGRALLERRAALTKFLASDIPMPHERALENHVKLAEELKQVLSALADALPSSDKPKPFKEASEITSRVDGNGSDVKVYRPSSNRSESAIDALKLCARARLRLGLNEAVIIVNPEAK